MSFFKGIANKIGKGVETANIKSQQMMNVSRLNLAIKGKEDDISRLHSRLGVAVYRSWDVIKRGSVTPEIEEIVQAIRDLNRELIALKRERLDVQGKMECPGCGKVIGKDNQVCPLCNIELSVRDLLAKPTDESVKIETSKENTETKTSPTDSEKRPIADTTTDPVSASSVPSTPITEKPEASAVKMGESSSSKPVKLEKIEPEVLDRGGDDQKEDERSHSKGRSEVAKTDPTVAEPAQVEELASQSTVEEEAVKEETMKEEEKKPPLTESAGIFLCLHCGHQVDEDKTSCSHCGATL